MFVPKLQKGRRVQVGGIKMNNPLNLFKYWRKWGWKKTKKEWTKQYLMLETPENLLKKEIGGYIGMMAALLFALVVFAFKKSWSVAILFLVSIYIAYTQMKGKLMQLHKLNEMTRQFQESGGDKDGTV